ncbi:MAG: Hsp70 family protein, partial [Planctomycetota bacterium]
LGVFRLDGIPPAPAGVPKIEVTFDINANGILNVTAKDTASGKEQKITIESSSGLSKDDIERMKNDAEKNAKADEARAELVQAKNQADSLVAQTRRQLEELGDKLSAEDKTKLEEELKKVEDAAKTDDKAKIDAAMQSFTQVSHKLFEQLYAQQGGEPAAGGAATSQAETADSPEEDVIDADFEVKS